MSVQVTNPSSGLSGKTLLTEEGTATIEALHTFDLDPAAPFAVTPSSAKVTNLDADMVDGLHSADLLALSASQTVTGTPSFSHIAQTGLKVYAAGDTGPLDIKPTGTLTAPRVLNVHTGDLDTTIETDFTSVAFSAGNFTANGSMTWTVGSGDQQAFMYRKIATVGARTVYQVVIHLITTTVGGTPNTQLQITIPLTAFHQHSFPVSILNNGTPVAGWGYIAASAAQLNLQLGGFTNFSAATNATDVSVEFSLTV